MLGVVIKMLSMSIYSIYISIYKGFCILEFFRACYVNNLGCFFVKN